jgi:hypothetical protein
MDPKPRRIPPCFTVCRTFTSHSRLVPVLPEALLDSLRPLGSPFITRAARSHPPPATGPRHFVCRWWDRRLPRPGGGRTVPTRVIHAGRTKNDKHLAACREADDQFIPTVLDAFGGWSPAARHVIQRGCRTLAPASGRWTLASARRWWTQRLSLALWRGNARAVQGCLAGDEHRHPVRSRYRRSTVLPHLCSSTYRPSDFCCSREPGPHFSMQTKIKNRRSAKYCNIIFETFVLALLPQSRGGRARAGPPKPATVAAHPVPVVRGDKAAPQATCDYGC